MRGRAHLIGDDVQNVVGVVSKGGGTRKNGFLIKRSCVLLNKPGVPIPRMDMWLRSKPMLRSHAEECIGLWVNYGLLHT